LTGHDFDVAVVGNVGVDTNIYLHGDAVDFDVEANFTENIDYVGQAGGYASRGYAQLGKRTAFVGHVGDDHNGLFVRNAFMRDGIDTTALFVDPCGTARSINFMYPDGRRKNFFDGKGHMTLQPDLSTCGEILARARLAHFNIPNWARQLLPIARRHGLTVACDIQDVDWADDPYRQDFIRQTDILFFSSTNYEDPSPLIESFLAKNRELTIIAGRGARGCALGTRDGVRFLPPVELEAPVIDTNGAGDGLAVGFLTSYVLDGYNLEDALMRGQIVARHTCTLKASTNRLINRQQLDRFFSRQA
jgi:sugar/nucleoside kinase (ribokinase family)